ncbi:MAG: sugar phosphate isomerase/epimerase family protein, partial [Oscillospiraceae bacterium]
LATCPASWGIFWADARPSGVPAEVFMNQAAAAGYVGIELGPVGYLPTTREELQKEFAPRGLVARAGTTCLTLDNLQSFEDWRENAQKMCSLLQSLDVQYLVMMDESEFAKTPEGKRQNPQKMEKCYNIVKDYVAFARRFGVTVVYHPHAQTIVETEEEILKLMRVTDCMLCLDTGHHQLINGKAEFGNDTTTRFYVQHHARIPFLHFKNVGLQAMLGYQKTGSMDPTPFCPLADGVIDFAQFAAALQETNYDGIGVVEQDMPHAPAEESYWLAIANREYLQKTGIIA